MNLKNLYLSTAVLAVLAVITYFVKNSDSSVPQDPRVGTAIVTNDALDSVATLEMISGTESMTFNFEDGQWYLLEQYNLPAESRQVTDLISKLKETKLERVASTNQKRIADFGFGIDYINLLDDQGQNVLSLDLGRETDSGKQLVRFGDEQVAFIADDTFTVNADPVSWLDKTLVDVESDSIRSASITLLDGETLEVGRETADAEWTTSNELPEGKQLDQSAIDRTLNRATTVRFNKLATLDAPEVTAAAANSYSISYSLEDGTEYSLNIGRRAEVRVEKEVESTNEEGETVTEMEEEVETPAGPVYVKIESSKENDPLNEYMSQTAFATNGTIFTSAPESLDSLLADIPAEEPEEESEEG